MVTTKNVDCEIACRYNSASLQNAFRGFSIGAADGDNAGRAHCGGCGYITNP
jgi:hypothetical protein